MRNPYTELLAPQLENPTGEEVEGAFSCQEQGCYAKPTTTARYLEELHVLTWVCSQGHISKIKDFDLYG